MIPTKIDVTRLNHTQMEMLLEMGDVVPADVREQLQERLTALRTISSQPGAGADRPTGA